MSYFLHPLFVRSKKVIELGSGYGLAGLVIAAVTDALEVVISDGNPQVVDCILLIYVVMQRNTIKIPFFYLFITYILLLHGKYMMVH